MIVICRSSIPFNNVSINFTLSYRAGDRRAVWAERARYRQAALTIGDITGELCGVDGRAGELQGGIEDGGAKVHVAT